MTRTVTVKKNGKVFITFAPGEVDCPMKAAWRFVWCWLKKHPHDQLSVI